MRILKSHVLLRLVNSYVIDSPEPANISYLWNFGSLLGVCLIIQILTGAFLAMHYQPNVDLAFNSVEHIMRDVNNGWILRYTHANVASFFFIFVYIHVGRGLYYGSYKSPRTLVWSIGVIILILMMATAFLGYVLPYGQMSLWGYFISPTCLLYKFNITKMYYIISKYIHIIIIIILAINIFIFYINIATKIENTINSGIASINNRIKGINRIGPHNEEVLSIIFGSLLGDAYAESKILLGGTRISFFQEGKHISYILWLHNLLASRGYCNIIVPKITTRLGKGGIIRKIVRFHTWTYTSFNWIHELWYSNGIKLVPKNIANYLTPLALAIWIMNDGSKSSKGLKLSTNSFTFQDCQLISQVLHDNFKLKSSVQSTGAPNQYVIYI